jgi:nucleoid-associated protein YgaU
MKHVIRPDDTLQRIAARYYGDWTLWGLIADVNRLNPRDNLTAGRVLDIPVPRIERTVHTVTLADTYESLSFMYYETERYANRLRTANGSAIIYQSVGKQFEIPALGSRSKINSMGMLDVS